MIFGQGTGGYITLATASLDKYSEVLTTTSGVGKFVGSNGLPYVIERVPLPGGGVLYINGDIEGKVFYGPEEDKMLFNTIKENLNNNVVKLIEMDTDINNKEFAEKAAVELIKMIEK